MPDFDDFLAAQVAEAEQASRLGLAEEARSRLTPEERYAERSFLAEGGQKRVFRCRDLASGREVALALPKPSASPEQLTKFLREARLNARLEHPNIMPVYDCGRLEGEGSFFTMKLIRRHSLQQALDQGGIDFDSALAALAGVCRALSYAHEKGILHFDVKPDNIQLSDHGEVLLCDWGLAGIAYEDCSEDLLADEELRRIDLRQSLDSIAKGTPGYAAPEMWRHGSRRDRRCDVYSLGAVLRQILQHFPAATATALHSVAAKAMSEDPDSRYPGAEEFRLEIERFRGGFATGAEQAGPGRLLWLLIRRHRSLSLVLGAAIALLLLSSLLFVRDLQKSEAESRLLAQGLESERQAKETLLRRDLPGLLRQAQKLFRDRDFDACASQLALVRSIDPELPEGRLLESFLRLSRGDVEGAAPLLPEKLRAALPGLRRGDTTGLMQFLAGLDFSGREPETSLYRNLLFARHASLSTLEAKRELAVAEWQLKLGLAQAPQLHLEARAEGIVIDASGNPGINDFYPLEKLALGQGVARLDLSSSGCTAIPFLPLLEVRHLELRQLAGFHLGCLRRTSVRELDLRGSTLLEEDALRLLPLESLDLRGSSFYLWDVLLELPRLRQLAVDPGRLPPSIRQRLPVNLKIIEGG
ncbi:MAG: hypothetical protein RL095_3410 [Verrucomicrobiota bacterium]|jgi:hypothetical protein